MPDSHRKESRRKPLPRCPRPQTALHAVLALAFTFAVFCGIAASPRPQVNDPRLELELFAEHPEIVTPTGLAVDRQGRILVIESHTHKRRADYEGPKHDRILLLEETDSEAGADRRTVFFDGLTHAMQLAVHPDGSVYAVTRNRVLRLRDVNDDGRAEKADRILLLETPATYPHNGLSGIDFDARGGLYIGLGENHNDPFTLAASDGTQISADDGSGRIFHCRKDGSDLREVATGLWNPFGLTVDAFGRVFVTDNDPGDRPPCRLIHIVPGGNYGYQRRYQSGFHPFNAWDGELPGTLPMVSGTAEAPTGLVAYESDGLPQAYHGTLMLGSWSDHRIEVYHLQPKGGSYHANRKTLVQGDLEFRPVGLAVGPDGSLYFSDWVDPQYAVHGKGRIWRLHAKDGSSSSDTTPASATRSSLQKKLHVPDQRTRQSVADRLAATTSGRQHLIESLIHGEAAKGRAAALRALAHNGIENAPYEAVAKQEGPIGLRVLAARKALDHGTDPLELHLGDMPPAVQAIALRKMRLPQHKDALLEGLAHEDPFIRAAAIDTLSRTPKSLRAIAWSSLESSKKRAGILLALQRSNADVPPSEIDRFLNDPDEPVRFMATKWVADEKLTTHSSHLREMMNEPGITLRLFKGISAALDRLEGRPPRNTPPPARLMDKIFDAQAPVRIRTLALQMIPPDYDPLSIARLKPLLDHDHPSLRLEAIRTLQRHSAPKRFSLLRKLASDTERRSIERAEAIVGLAPHAADHKAILLKLAVEASSLLQAEALRALIGVEFNSKERAALKKLARDQPELEASIHRLLGLPRPSFPPPSDTDAWARFASQKGDPQIGRRLFFHSKVATCAQCHQMEGRGTRVGPALDAVGQTTSLKILLRSILEPAREVAPQFQPWRIETEDGQAHVGLPLRKSTVEIYRDATGETFRIAKDEIRSKEELSTSLMPPGLLHALTRAEIQDLVAYLRQGTHRK